MGHHFGAGLLLGFLFRGLIHKLLLLVLLAAAVFFFLRWQRERARNLPPGW